MVRISNIGIECRHGGSRWCSDCVRELCRGVDDDLDRKDNRINQQFKIIRKLEEAPHPKHGYGVPPVEKGVWLLKSKHLQNPEHLPGYWGVYKLVSVEDNWQWSDELLEYFGPIPFEVWNVVKKEEEKTLSQQYDELNLDGPEDHATYQDFMRRLASAVDHLQANQDPMPITKGAGMQ